MTKGHEETFGDDRCGRYICYLACDDGFQEYTHFKMYQIIRLKSCVINSMSIVPNQTQPNPGIPNEAMIVSDRQWLLTT